MKLIIFGAGGRIGRHLIEQATKAGHDVTGYLRDAKAGKTLGCEVVIGDVRDADAVESAIRGRDAILSAVGHTDPKKVNGLYSVSAKNFTQAAERAGVERLISMSTMIGDSTPRTGFLFRRIILPLVLKDVWSDHEAAEAVYRASALDWTTIRAGRLTDGPKTGKYRAGLGLRGNVFSSVSRSDVADFMIRELGARQFVRQCPDILG